MGQRQLLSVDLEFQEASVGVSIQHKHLPNAIKIKYKVVLAQEVYNWIDEKKDINLDHCYIKNFSLKSYRKLKELDEDSEIRLNNFSAKHAFFDADHEVDFAHGILQGEDVSFHSSYFNKGKVSFYKCHFESPNTNITEVFFGTTQVDFQYASFAKGNVSFENTIFNGDVSFVNTNFGDGKAIFRNTDFGDGKTDFHYSQFGKGEKVFERARFGNGRTDFRKVDFGVGKVDFRRAEFCDGEISFEESEFKSGKINFRSATFGHGELSFEMVNFGKDEVSFEKCDFGSGNVSFKNSVADTLKFNGCHLNNYLDLRVSNCALIDLSDTIVKDIIDFTPVDNTVFINRLNISGMRNLGRIFIDWTRNNVEQIIKANHELGKSNVATQFRILKEDFRNNGMYNEEDYAYVLFKRFEAEAALEDALKGVTPIKRFNAYFIYYSQKILFDKIGSYATNPLRVLKSMAVIYFIYSIMFYLVALLPGSMIQSSLGDPEHLSLIERCFYYCAITFLTIGYGDYYPLGWEKYMAIVVGFSGVFMMSYFVVAFVRKILR